VTHGPDTGPTERIPLIVVPNTVLLPRVRLPLRPRGRANDAAVRAALDGPGLLGVARAWRDDPRTGDGVFGVGRIIDYEPARAGAAARLEVIGIHRAERPGGRAGPAGVAVQAGHRPAPAPDAGQAARLGETLLSAAADLGQLSLRRELEALVADLRAAGDPGDERIMNLLATVIVGQDEVRQQLLEVDDPLIRGRHLLNIFETLFQELAGPGQPREEQS
jgi:hypothetical protein